MTRAVQHVASDQSPAAIQPHRITDPLPTGTTLLEASAGTGKTWTIGALVARFVAEGEARLDEMLVVTFGRAASQELRERVRAQLVELEQAYADPAAPRSANEVVDLLLDVDEPEREQRRRRVREALAEFDAATIATTHQFCQLVLRSLGVAGDTDAEATLVEDLDELLVEVVDDLYLRGFADTEEPPLFSRSEALRLARGAVSDPQARLEPADADPGSPAGRRVAFCGAVRTELARRKRLLGVLGYDDLLSQLAEALARPEAPARVRMRQRWRVVLVDEFQDTDPVQWNVLDRAFTGHARMVLIGDPKQAIYAFRGGDVVTYLDAAETASQSRTLATNWRSDQALLDRMQVVLEGAALGDPRIVVRPVQAAHAEPRLVGAPEPEPFTVRVLTRSMLGRRGSGGLPVAQVRPLIAADCAAQIKRLLLSDATVDGRPVHPGDVAVLAHTGAQLQAVHAALTEAGVPAVIAGGGSVFRTPAAREWLTLMEAMEQPHRSARVRAAALTPFLGLTAQRLDADPTLTDALSERIVEWAGLFTRRGVAAVLEAAVIGGLHERVLTWTEGERHLTDLRHVGQALHQVVMVDRLGLVAVVQWLREQVADESPETGSERTRRLDSDAAAVQLVTIHGSKGLQYPIVHLPFVADRWVGKPDLPRFHAPTDQQRCLDVGGSKGPRWRDDTALHQAEEAGESLRLLYVAMTRAQSQLVTWWAPSNNATGSPLHRMLIGRGPGMAAVPDQCELPTDEAAHGYFEAWRARGGPVWRLATAEFPEDPLRSTTSDELAVRRFARDVDTVWRRTSYSALSAAAESAGLATVDSEPEQVPRDDEPETAEPGPAAPITLPGDLPSPMADLPVGAAFGSLVHAVLEHADPAAPDFAAELLTRIHEQLPRWPAPVDPEELAAALVTVCETPLGPLAGELRLVDLPLRRRMRELEFELPLAGGDVVGYPADEVRLGDLAGLLREHLPAHDPLLPYADALADPALGSQVLRGYLTGSIDLVMESEGRFLVVDYKTNWLGRPDQPLTAADYRPEALAAAMGHSDYPLQALLYAVVLHRYLRWRLPDYDPGSHLGGVLYLYLRGMCGPETPRVDGQPTGVFAWHPPAALVVAISDLLDGVKGAP
ncbi:UvrD-helicase domain-containing protein [Nocardioides daejeonensis]|uniref:UvrD-helicase domain-containing protein n=1 Tax=Nocardioides daejeonensis TaxID=1046556 RepID=UPI000D740BF5|nr:UvrD-helicase domain-containing protein [Nocardioides daejeonensis]